ncbi:MAG: hypothetical protein HY692_08465 [Cyanobacteria bacterium NC_groundwater_1444_Ag_S-0.65um_54_12]|nr:hypothetical protein [Cyanobacteria bacterium NC_groundwater_1444_Ag_S-0.65um_54_12]
MKRLALALAVMLPVGLLALTLPVFAAEPYDAPTLSLGGSYLTRQGDVTSPYWSPANLTNTRGFFYVGPSLSLLLGNNVVGVIDVMQALTDPPQGKFENSILYLQEIGRYQKIVEEAIKTNTDPDEAPNGASFPLPEEFSLFLRTDMGLLGLNIPYAENNAIGLRSYVRQPGEFFISAPAFFDTLNQVTTIDKEIADQLRDLRNKLLGNAFNLGDLPATADGIKGKLIKGLGPLATEEGMSLTLGINEGLYLTNALSLQLPLPWRLPIDWADLSSSSISIGGTFKVHTGLGALGVNEVLQNSVSKVIGTTDGSPVNIGVPGRIEMINTLSLKKPFEEMLSALESFKSNPASGSADLQSKASGITNAYKAEFVTYTAGPIGFGLDLGASLPLGKSLTLGAMLQNITFWPGTKTKYGGSFGGGEGKNTNTGIVLTPQGAPEAINFTYTEPLGVRFGMGWQGPLGLSASAEVAEALDGPSTRPFSLGSPSFHLGVQESIFNFIYLRAGTQLGGKGSLLGGGAGLNIGIARLDLGVATDYSGGSLGVALSFNVGI